MNQKTQNLKFRAKDFHNTFDVEILCEIISAFKTTSRDDKEKIYRSWRHSWMKALSETVKPLRGSKLIEIWNDNFPEFPGKQLESTLAGALVGVYLWFRCEEFSPLVARDNPKAKQQALWLLRFKEFRPPNNNKRASGVLLNAMTQAVTENDVEFFKQLGRRLSEKPKALHEPLPKHLGFPFLQILYPLVSNAEIKLSKVSWSSSCRGRWSGQS